MKRILITLIFIFSTSFQATELTKVEQQMKQEFIDCLSAQNKSTEVYTNLKDKDLETYSELPKVKEYYNSLLLMISRCQKVYAFNQDVKQGKKLKDRIGKAIINLEHRNDLKEYCNSRFDFCINYDEDFGIEPASTNGDGRIFYARDGFKMYVFGTHITIDESLKTEIEFRSEHIDITYKKITENWAVVSGHQKNKVIYIKILKINNIFKILEIEYPIETQYKYNVLVEKIVPSFKSTTFAK